MFLVVHTFEKSEAGEPGTVRTEPKVMGTVLTVEARCRRAGVCTAFERQSPALVPYAKHGQVYVLKRGKSPDMPAQDLRNKDLWRVGKVTAYANGRFTVQYEGEEGKPKESRIVAERLRVRKVVRQKAVQKVTKKACRSTRRSTLGCAAESPCDTVFILFCLAVSLAVCFL